MQKALYQNILRTTLTWARQNENLQAVVLFGSWARKENKADQWSDLDLLLICQDISSLITDTSWINLMGTPILTFRERAFDGSYECRVIYEGFIDVDYALCETSELSEAASLGILREIFKRGYQILLDKDKLISKFDFNQSPPRDENPSIEFIVNEINDYYFHTSWIVKKMKRGEIWTALQCLNCYMKEKLLTMLELYTHFHNANQDTLHRGRLLETWIDPWILRRLKGCFADYDKSALHQALKANMALYRQLAEEVAMGLGIAFPWQNVVKITTWVSGQLS